MDNLANPLCLGIDRILVMCLANRFGIFFANSFGVHIRHGLFCFCRCFFQFLLKFLCFFDLLVYFLGDIRIVLVPLFIVCGFLPFLFFGIGFRLRFFLFGFFLFLCGLTFLAELLALLFSQCFCFKVCLNLGFPFSICTVLSILLGVCNVLSLFLIDFIIDFIHRYTGKIQSSSGIIDILFQLSETGIVFSNRILTDSIDVIIQTTDCFFISALEFGLDLINLLVGLVYECLYLFSVIVLSLCGIYTLTGFFVHLLLFDCLTFFGLINLIIQTFDFADKIFSRGLLDFRRFLRCFWSGLISIQFSIISLSLALFSVLLVQVLIKPAFFLRGFGVISSIYISRFFRRKLFIGNGCMLRLFSDSCFFSGIKFSLGRFSKFILQNFCQSTTLHIQPLAHACHLISLHVPGEITQQ